jgi:2-polyprenyl-3-methyl-5-hydroxy-6-metoxy-1,4-benzoquinol methylase
MSVGRNASEILQRMNPHDYGYNNARHSHTLHYLLPVIRQFLAGVEENSRILDLGCGNGSLTAALCQSNWIMHGVDASASGIRIAREQHPTIKFECGLIDSSLVTTLGPNSFDAIVCAEVVEHMYHPRDLAKCAFELLHPGGRFVITTPYHGYLKNLLLALSGEMDQHWTALWDGGHIKFWSRRTLQVLLEEVGFKDFRFEGCGRLPLFWKSMAISCIKPL